MHEGSQLREAIVRLVPGGEQSLSHLADDELLSSTRRLVGVANKLLAQLLLHLAEVEARGIHRTRACASLYTYCIYELRMSEDAAARRSSAARLVKRFPLLFDAIASGELHLTGLLMLGPHLTLENHVEVLARAKFRTKKEITKLVRELHPLPRVPDLVQPLGPELPRSPRKPTWNEWVTSLCPPVRELAEGESPRDWANEANDVIEANEADDTVEGAGASESAHAEASESARVSSSASGAAAGSADASGPAGGRASGADTRQRVDADIGVDDSFTPPARGELPPITAPQQYQMQFCTTEQHVRLVERAKALLARSAPSITLGELHLQAMRLLVERLEKESFAVTERPRKARRLATSRQAAQAGEAAPGTQPESTNTEPGVPANPTEHTTPAPRQRGATTPAPRQRRDVPTEHTTPAPRQRGDVPTEHTTPAPRQRARHVPATVKREVFLRDAGCCSYVDQRGQRCGETRYLELHHLTPFALGGEHVASNLALRCAAHNALAAETDFGRSVVERRRHPARHDSFSTLQRHESR